MNKFEQDLDIVIQEIRTMLIEKNKKYGDSALSPIQVFSKLDPIEAIKIRLDDKCARIKNNTDGDTEDPVFDLMGYLLLLRMAELRKSQKNHFPHPYPYSRRGVNLEGIPKGRILAKYYEEEDLTVKNEDFDHSEGQKGYFTESGIFKEYDKVKEVNLGFNCVYSVPQYSKGDADSIGSYATGVNRDD